MKGKDLALIALAGRLLLKPLLNDQRLNIRSLYHETPPRVLTLELSGRINREANDLSA